MAARRSQKLGSVDQVVLITDGFSCMSNMGGAMFRDMSSTSAHVCESPSKVFIRSMSVGLSFGVCPARMFTASFRSS